MGAPIAEYFAGIHPKDRGRIEEAVDRAIATGEKYVQEYRLLQKDGMVRWVEARGECLYGKDGKPLRFPGAVVDITDRKQAEVAVRRSEERQRAALQIGTVGVLFFNLDGEITDANDALLRMVGYNRDELAAGLLRWDRLTPPEFMAASLRCISELEATGQSTPYEKQYFRKDGSRIWLLFAARMLDGREAVEFAIDITERKQTEDALRESDERLRALLTQTAGGISQTDLTGRYIFVNQRFCDMVGYREDELTGMRMQDITHPDDVSGNLRLSRRMIETGASFEVEKRFKRKDGTFAWASVSVAPIRNAAGQVHQAAAVAIDIAERKHAEEIEHRIAAIIESSDDAIVSTNLDDVITSWNGGAERLYGYRAEEMIGRPLTSLLPDDRQDEGRRILELIRRDEHVRSYETVRRHKDGNPVEVSLTVSPIRDAHGRIVGSSKIARDISERRRAERIQRTLVHELNHRVKNILATIQAIARQTFPSGQGDDEARRTFDARLFALSKAHDLLTRTDWGGAELSEVVAEVIAPYHREWFEIDGPDVRLTPRTALALALAMHELATNAAKYGALSVPTGRVAITWAVRAGDPRYLTFRWQERGGPLVVPPSHKGFGSRLIERSLAMELAGVVQITYDPAGVVCDVTAPLSDGPDTGSAEAA
jgi:PAS domain S-box-containing protein